MVTVAAEQCAWLARPPLWANAGQAARGSRRIHFAYAAVPDPYRTGPRSGHASGMLRLGREPRSDRRLAAAAGTIRSNTLATPNYAYEKRQRELAKKRKNEEKLQRKTHRGPGDGPMSPGDNTGPGTGASSGPGDSSSPKN
jgi:hypothetical protein